MRTLQGCEELCINDDHIIISNARFEELLKKEAQLDMLLVLRSRMKYDSNYVDVVDALRFAGGYVDEGNQNAE